MGSLFARDCAESEEELRGGHPGGGQWGSLMLLHGVMA